MWVWFAPSALFILVTSVGSTVIDRSALPAWVLVASLGTLVLAGVVAALGERARREPAQWIVSLLLIGSGALVHVADGGRIGASLLLVGLPAGWMGFELGARGAATAVTAIWAVAAGAEARAVPEPLQRWEEVVTALGLTMMVLLTSYAGRILRGTQAEVMARSHRLEREVATTRAIFDSVDAALVVFLPDGQVLANEPATRLGHRLEVATTARSQRAAPAEHTVVAADGVTVTAPADQALMRAERGEEFAGLVQWTGPREDRRAMVCSARSIVLDGCPGAVGTVFVAWDATDALDTARAHDEFLGTLTHELRTPLTAIVGYLELHEELAGDDRDPAARAYLDGVRRNVQSLADHIDDLLVTARPEELGTMVFDVASVTRATVASVEDRARNAGLTLDLHCPESLVAVANDTAVRQTLDHLLDNALTYTETGGITVEVFPSAGGAGTEAGSTGVTVVVTDTGIGMTEHELTRIFDRFYRSEQVVRRVLPGLGMGLAATRRLVASHGGTISVRSRPGAGSRFEVTFPGTGHHAGAHE